MHFGAIKWGVIPTFIIKMMKDILYFGGATLITVAGVLSGYYLNDNLIGIGALATYLLCLGYGAWCSKQV